MLDNADTRFNAVEGSSPSLVVLLLNGISINVAISDPHAGSGGVLYPIHWQQCDKLMNKLKSAGCVQLKTVYENNCFA